MAGALAVANGVSFAEVFVLDDVSAASRATIYKSFECRFPARKSIHLMGELEYARRRLKRLTGA
jgi:hypothetical protein